MKRDTLDNRDLTIIMALIILSFATLAVVVWAVDRRLDALEDIVLTETACATHRAAALQRRMPRPAMRRWHPSTRPGRSSMPGLGLFHSRSRP